MTQWSTRKLASGATVHEAAVPLDEQRFRLRYADGLTSTYSYDGLCRCVGQVRLILRAQPWLGPVTVERVR